MTFHITSSSWTGYIEVEYNELGYLVHSDIRNAELSETQQKWFLNRLPRELAELKRTIDGTTATIEEVTQVITFTMFWDRYNEKIRSSKKKAITTWNRMAVPEHIKAYNFIKKYEANIPTGVAKKYAETYLNAELWNN